MDTEFFPNHSCEPNCYISREGGRAYIVSLRKIDPSEELTYDYDYDTGFRVPCLCGSDSCRGYI